MHGKLPIASEVLNIITTYVLQEEIIVQMYP